MAEPPEEVVAELYGAPFDEFTALRDARAKELRPSDREAAAALKKLRKPSVAAWAVNQLARQAAEDVEALLAAGAALRQAQLGGGDRDSIRESSRDEREAVERLVSCASALLRKAGRGTSDAVLEEVRETLRAAASDDASRELIRRGVLTESRRAVGMGGFEAAFAAGPAKPAAPRAAKAAKPDKAAAAARKSALKAARDAVAEAEKAAAAAGAAVGDAEGARDAARDALERAEKQLAAANEQAETAREEAERRRWELEELEGAG